MDVAKLKVGEWFLFYSDWHNHAVMGQFFRLVLDAKPSPRAGFQKICMLDGSSAQWKADAQIFVLIDEIIKPVNESK
jgi:hypothetical protein